MKTLKDFNFKDKKVLVRCDFNVPISPTGLIEDDSRIRETLPTINYLLEQKAKVILLSHLGNPEGKFDESLTLEPVRKKLEEYLKVPVSLSGQGIEPIVENMKQGHVLLLENLRFNPGEEANDPAFAKELSSIGDIFVNDAFSVCHRIHASIVGIPKYLPSCAGLLLEKEIKVLSQVLNNPWRPLVAIIGGAKISSKAGMIQSFLDKADHLLLGGKIANVILQYKGIYIKEEKIEEIKGIEKFDLTSTKLHLPVDGLVSADKEGDTYVRESALAKVKKDELLLDIGPETVKMFSSIIKEAKMIVWSGPLGFFENPRFEKGTKEIIESIIKNHKAYKLAGGGDTVSAISKLGLADKFDHVSTGGGAMLSYLGGEEMPGLDALEK